MKTEIVTPQLKIELDIQRHRRIINRLIAAVLIIAAILVAFLVLTFCECFVLTSNIPFSGWLMVKGTPFLFLGTAFLFRLYRPVYVWLVVFAAGVAIVQCWASYDVSGPLHGFSAAIIEMTSQMENAEISGTPFG